MYAQLIANCKCQESRGDPQAKSKKQRLKMVNLRIEETDVSELTTVQQLKRELIRLENEEKRIALRKTAVKDRLDGLISIYRATNNAKKQEIYQEGVGIRELSVKQKEEAESDSIGKEHLHPSCKNNDYSSKSTSNNKKSSKSEPERKEKNIINQRANKKSKQHVPEIKIMQHQEPTTVLESEQSEQQAKLGNEEPKKNCTTNENEESAELVGSQQQYLQRQHGMEEVEA